MAVKPELGNAGGQKYPVLRSIQTFLGQMAEGGARVAPAVMKELLQNADDAGATEVAVILDERAAPHELSCDYADLLSPALLLRNNAKFRLAPDVEPGEPDDFSAICDVASGHKRAQATAAGRFGIGFNSVYFLTDTPLLFSRREVHIFDLLHKVFFDDGWRFPLDEFPALTTSAAGSAKAAIEWCLPKCVLTSSFADLAHDAKADYEQTVFRLPLRRSQEGTPALYGDRFRDAAERQRILFDGLDEASRSLLFLKNVCRVTFGILRDRDIEPVGEVQITPSPNEFRDFLHTIQEENRDENASRALRCAFERVITCSAIERGTGAPAVTTKTWKVHVRHSARFDDEGLNRLRARLRKNGERAIPWVALGVPVNPEACHLDGGDFAKWRVFLPLLEDGPSACIMSGAFFVGPSRQRTEFRLDESDEGNRRTNWNQTLVKQALIPLLRDVSTELPSIAPVLLEKYPKEYVSLFPRAADIDNGKPGNLTDFVRMCFSDGLWALSLSDIWNEKFELFVGDAESEIRLELTPAWLIVYRDRFKHLSTQSRCFVRNSLGEALTDRIGRDAGVVIQRNVAKDVALEVLRHAVPPDSKDLRLLLRPLVLSEISSEELEGVWAFAKSRDDGLLQFSAATLYVIDDATDTSAISKLRDLGLPFIKTEWIRGDIGLPSLAADFKNIVKPTETAAIELLRRLPPDNAHDRVSHDYLIRPIIDFLIDLPVSRIPDDLRLGFLVKTAHQKADRRKFEVILLKSESPTLADEALWEVWFRRVFAEVDPGFSREIHRLLAAHSGYLGMLTAQDCRIAISKRENAIRLLHDVRSKHPEIIQLLDREINSARQGSNPDLATNLANALIEDADAHWDSLDLHQKTTVLTLPIHRRSDGRFVSLISNACPDLPSVRKAFHLQSEDDIEDAPVDLRTCDLLQTVNSTVKRFYRRRIELEEHGRIAVLKATLLQIGERPESSESMLRYLTRYYDEAVKKLEKSGNEEDRRDAQELVTLLSSARTVPCIGGAWEVSSRCVEAWGVRDHLAKQRWPDRRLDLLVKQLFDEENIASCQAWVRSLIPRLHQLEGHDTAEIAACAITSESKELSLSDRVKLVGDNWRDVPEKTPTASSAVRELTVPTVSGRVPLGTAELFVDTRAVPRILLRLLAPTAVDLVGLGKELEVPTSEVSKILPVFGVTTLSTTDLVDRLTKALSEIWGALSPEERMQVLSYLGECSLGPETRSQAAQLDAVLVAADPPRWVRPSLVVSPKWMKTQPPNLDPETSPVLQKIPDAVQEIWDAWCGVQTFSDVFVLVLNKTTSDANASAIAAAIYSWLDRVGLSRLDEECLAALRSRAWVFARKGEEYQFLEPSQVIMHPGERILGSHFWVPARPIPRVISAVQDKISFQKSPPATPETLQLLSECLVEASADDVDCTISIYQLVESIALESVFLYQQWLSIAQRSPVYRVFRAKDRNASALQLFIGNAEYKDDLAANLLCLKAASTLPKGLTALYRSLGVSDSPTLSQVLFALSDVTNHNTQTKGSYSRLVRMLEELAPSSEESITSLSYADLCALTCAGTYQKISSCYWDAQFGRRDRVSAIDGGARLIDTSDKTTQRLVTWIRNRRSDDVTDLRAISQIRLGGAPQPIKLTPEMSYFLLPWRQWLQEAARQGSLLRQQLSELGINPPEKELELIPATKIIAELHLQDKEVIKQALKWEGPFAIACADGRLYVRPTTPSGECLSVDWKAVSEFDNALAAEIAISLIGAEALANLSLRVEQILRTLERPSTVLRRLGETYRQHFLHQYHDQVADPSFAELFEEYQRTAANSARAETEKRMYALLEQGFVQARRDQIRGYGYDEFSVFAELLQNAEDAYTQRACLGMSMPEVCDVSYRYLRSDDHSLVLEVQHSGRPFNYWQHGDRQDRSFSRDVEGVLRSAGSFKPHFEAARQGESQASTIGRFGLGFKSVYLITDCPEIYSGAWHFAIQAGCIPQELRPPSDLPQDVTRIRLPLRTDAQEVSEATGLLDLVPFLREVKRLVLHSSNGKNWNLDVNTPKSTDKHGVIVEQVEISAAEVLHTGSLRILRCRSAEHQGQLALLLTDDDTPARWDEIFHHDLFAVLPLKVQLGCGVAASHRFEVQSGRTHLVDPQANAPLVAEIAGLLRELVSALITHTEPTASQSKQLTRFWALWRWDKGDSEGESLRRALACALADLAEREPVVPTVDPNHPLALGRGPCFFFYDLPDEFCEALLAHEFALPRANAKDVRMTGMNVVAQGFAAAYRRTCEYAGANRSANLLGIGWDQVASACLERPWFAEKPDLLSILARSINDDQLHKAGSWVALCRVLGFDQNGSPVHLVPSDLLPHDFPGIDQLPRRFVRTLSPAYEARAVLLLQRAGLPERPSSEDLCSWIQTPDIASAECVAILRYLSGDSRFRYYWGVAAILRSAWFPCDGKRLSTSEASDRGLLPTEVIEDETFRAWLGLAGGQEPTPEPQRPPQYDARCVLSGLMRWWKTNGEDWTARYEERTYPEGHPPELQRIFDGRDLGDRREWVTLLLIGSFHTMGRTNPDQHRNFLLRCERKGWLDVFAERDQDARRWMQVLEEYLDDPFGNDNYYQWMKQFVSIFQISRWLSEYVDSFLSVDRIKEPFALDQIISSRTSALFAGGGPDAPSLMRTLGNGSCFVLRELMRLCVLQNPVAHMHCYVIPLRVGKMLERLGCEDLQTTRAVERSSIVHRFLLQHLRAEEATFGNSFDLPLLALADEQELQLSLFGSSLHLDGSDN